MKMISNVHTHTTWCDGTIGPREMADAAIAIGFTDLGFSSHSPIPLEREYPWMTDEAGYIEEISKLKKEYSGRLNILCGIELDYFSQINREAYDYTIGSAHYLVLTPEVSVTVDNPSWQTPDAMRVYGGDHRKMYREYYSLVYQNVQKNRPDIVAHFDLPTKYNRDYDLFDEDGEDYKRTAMESLDGVLDIIIPYGGMIELNVSAFVRKLRDVPYPAPFLLERIAQRGGRIIITTDAHKPERLNMGFDTAVEFLKQTGFKSMTILKDKQFIDVGI